MKLKTEKEFEYNEKGKIAKETETSYVVEESEGCEIDPPCDCCECCDEDFAVEEIIQDVEVEVAVGKIAVASMVGAFVGGIAGVIVGNKFLK